MMSGGLTTREAPRRGSGITYRGRRVPRALKLWAGVVVSLLVLAGATPAHAHKRWVS